MELKDVEMRHVETLFGGLDGDDVIVRGVMANKHLEDIPDNRLYWLINLGNSKKISTHGKGPEEF